MSGWPWKKPIPTPAPKRPVAVVIRNLAGAQVMLEGVTQTGATVDLLAVTDPYGRAGFAAVPATLVQANLHIRHDGYLPFDTVVELPAKRLGESALANWDVIVGEWPGPLLPHQQQIAGLVARWPTPIPRPAFRPLPPDIPPTDRYNRELHFTLPPKNPLTHRANFCGIRVPGAPGVEGGANNTIPGGDTSLIMSSMLHKYDDRIQGRYLDGTLERGLSHVQQYVIAARAEGLTDAQYVTLAKKIQGWNGLYADHWFMGKHFNPENASRAYLEQTYDAIIERLLGEGAIDTACVAWEIDLFNAGGKPTQVLIDYFAERLGPHGIPLYIHTSTGPPGRGCTPWWGAADWGPEMVAWWQLQRGKLTGIHLQTDYPRAGDPFTTMNYLQSRLVDVLRNLWLAGHSGFGQPFQATIYECTAMNQYFENMTEAEGDLWGGLLLATFEPYLHFTGYGNGGNLDGRLI